MVSFFFWRFALLLEAEGGGRMTFSSGKTKLYSPLSSL